MEITPPNPQKKPATHLSRRDFLKVSALAAVTVTASRTKPVRELTSLPTGPDTDWISSQVPPELADKNIPTENEYYRHPLTILNEGVSLYESWRKNDSDLPEPIYKPPPNYLDTPRYTTLITSSDSQKNLLLLMNSLLDNDLPGHAFIGFSLMDITNVRDVWQNDPGTGLVRQIRDNINLSNDDLNKHLLESSTRWFENARSYINLNVKENGRQSTSLLLAYFLYKNRGNLSESVWDTVLWLKIAGRTNPKTWERELSRSGVEMLTTMFKDEFSLRVSANWVTENVSPNSTTLSETEPHSNMQFKDYMPINRAGSFYHPWNIMALATSVTPFVLERLIKAQHSYLKETVYNGKNSLSSDGREKVVADLTVANHADALKDFFNKYLN